MVVSLNQQYSGCDQHDSQEFLSFLLDIIHEDLNRVITKPVWKTTPEEEAELEKLPPQIASEREWKAWKMRNDSLIVDYFQGQLRNRLECMTCHQVRMSFSYQPMQCLNVSRRRQQRTTCSPCCSFLYPVEAARYIYRSVWMPSSITRSWRRMMRGLSHSFISPSLCGNPCPPYQGLSTM